jgi:hypothetical protein
MRVLARFAHDAPDSCAAATSDADVLSIDVESRTAEGLDDVEIGRDSAPRADRGPLARGADGSSMLR